jgi:putative colanic acid biosynthesis UDP-glucose lipid carrier transferase
MEYNRGRYSWLLRPFLIIYDISVINIFAYFLLNFNDKNLYLFSSVILNDKHLIYFLYSSLLWLLSTFLIRFYKVYRYTSAINIITLLVKQFLAYMIIVFAFNGIFRSISIEASLTFTYLIYSFLAIGIIKLFSFFILKTVRSYFKGNLRKVIIIGGSEDALELKNIFTNKIDLGYDLKAHFSDLRGEEFTGTINNSFEYLNNNNNIDEIYCSIDELSEKEIKEYVKYTNINKCNIKFIAKPKGLLTKRFKTDYYGYLPVLSIQDVSLNNDFNQILKRVFDVVFSFFIIIFVLSWLSIILFVLIKLESKGTLFYKHKRNGINYKEFICYKFRTLKINTDNEVIHVNKNDKRVTKIGKFLRKTSIDELPQFLNVLLGDMSVVGPRPHMLAFTEEYSRIVEKYNFIFRHNVKPGITGLAQIKGFRGEVETDRDIIGRVKYDIFYIENWSLLLDLKIIIKTFMNAVKGEKKAY